MTTRALPPGGIVGEIGNIAARQQGALGGGLSRLDTGAGVQAGPEPRDSLWIRIKGPPAADDRTGTALGAAMYDWEFIYRRDRDLFDLALQKSGGMSGYPAFEMNNFANVPGGAIVRAWFGANDDTIGLEFVYDQGECCDTGGGGGGGGSACCGYWVYNFGNQIGPGQPPSPPGWVWYTVDLANFNGTGAPSCTAIMGWVFCFDGRYHWVPPTNCGPPNVRITSFSPIVPCGTPAPSYTPSGGGAGTGGGAVCQGCNPAVDNPCYNCQNGLFCSNPEACFGGKSAALAFGAAGGGTAPSLPLFGGGFGSRFGSAQPIGSSSCSCGGSCGKCGGGTINPVAQAMVTGLPATMRRFGFAWGSNLGGYVAPFVTPEQLGLTADANSYVIGTSSGGITTAAIPIKPLFDHYADAGNTGSSETDLYSDTLAAGQLAANGQKIEASYSAIIAAGASATLKVYFGGTAIFSSGLIAAVSEVQIDVRVTIVRKDSATVRCTVGASGSVAAGTNAKYTEVGSLTLSNTQILKTTGTGTSNNDIVAKLGCVRWIVAA